MLEAAKDKHFVAPGLAWLIQTARGSEKWVIKPGFAWAPQVTNAKHLEYFVDMAGMSPMEAILAGTKFGGQIRGWAMNWVRSSRAGSPTCC